MSDPNANIASELLITLQAAKPQLAQMLSSGLGTPFEVVDATPGKLVAKEFPQDWVGPGLIFVFTVGEQGAWAVLPESSGLVPPSCIQPDAAVESRLGGLANDLGNLLFPNGQVSESSLVRVRDVATALQTAGLAAEAQVLAVSLVSAGKTGQLSLVWPSARPDAARLASDKTLTADGAEPPGEAVELPDAPSRAGSRPRREYHDLEDGIRLLPPYSRSLLKIRVPVTVMLAETRQPLKTVLDIGSGSIIHFNKSCDDTLTLEVGGHKIAVGETVKVGDKFGLWITAMILPDERFWIISGRQAVKRAK